MKKHLLFLGPPGAGKGTQAALLSEANSYLHLSTDSTLGIHRYFNKADVTQNGQLSIEEFGHFLEMANILLSEDDMEIALIELDR